MPKSANLFRRSIQKSGVFFTPKKLAEYMRSFFPTEVDEIYDPTCADAIPTTRRPASWICWSIQK